MVFYPPNPGRGQFQPRYRQRYQSDRSFGRQPAPFFYPNQPYGDPYRMQGFPGNMSNWMGPSNPFGSQPYPNYYPNQQPGAPYGMPNTLNTLMGHVGNITNGVNMIRQLGSFLGFFRIL